MRGREQDKERRRRKRLKKTNIHRQEIRRIRKEEKRGKYKMQFLYKNKRRRERKM